MTDVQGQQFAADFEELLQYEIHGQEWGRYGDMTGDNQVSLADVVQLARTVVSGGGLADEIAFRKADLTATGWYPCLMFCGWRAEFWVLFR